MGPYLELVTGPTLYPNNVMMMMIVRLLNKNRAEPCFSGDGLRSLTIGNTGEDNLEYSMSFQSQNCWKMNN